MALSEILATIGNSYERAKLEGFGGHIGRNYIEAHHLTPLHALSGEGPVLTNPETDFAVLCANCHKMIHAMGCPSIEMFKLNLQNPKDG